MGVIVRAIKEGVGWPSVGWAPVSGYVGQSITSVTVNMETALTIGAFHAGVRLIAEDIGALPLHVLERQRDGGARKATEHPSYRMLHAVANPEMTAMVWRETVLGHYYTWGNCYSEKEFDGQGNVVNLWPLRPDRMEVKRAPGTDTRLYHYRLPDGKVVVLPARNVFHVPAFGFDGLVGYSRVRMARRSLELAIAIEEFGLQTFANGARPGTVIRHPQQISKDAKDNIKASWDAQHKGLSNAERTAVLDEGMSVEEVGFPPEDAQFLGTKQHSVEEIARWLRLAPSKLSDMSRATFTNIEESNIDHVVGTLTPPSVRFEQQYDKDILGGAFYAKHNFAALMRGNAKDRAEFYAAMRQNGILTDDEIRALEDRNPLTVQEREHLLVPLNSVPASAYGADGMTMAQRINAAAVYVRAGYVPSAVNAALGLPPIEHTGLVPITVTLPDTGAQP